MVDVSEWQGRTGDAWAAEWRRTDRSMTMVTEELLRQTRGKKCDRIIDIGCGAGELSLALARGRPGSAITGVDVSPQLLEVARERAARMDNVEFVYADAASWTSDGDNAPDLLISRHGVMFFDEPQAAFSHLASQAAPSANLVFSCFRAPSENPVFTEPARLLPDAPEQGPPGPGPFAFADPARVEPILAAGGWSDVVFSPVDIGMIVGAGEDPIEDAVGYFSRIGPIARAASEMDSDARGRLFDRVRRMAQNNLRDGVVMLAAGVWIVTAKRN